MDYIDALYEDGFDVRQVSSREWACECPWCGGFDRFRDWPVQDDCGFGWCRKCGWSGDLIEYFRDYRGYGFKRACMAAGCEHKLRETSNTNSGRANGTSYHREQKTGPNAIWKKMAGKLVDFAVDLLWNNPTGKEALEWLKKERLLTEETIERANLGFLPEDYYRERDSWGLPIERDRRGREKDLFIFGHGIIIPKFNGTEVVRLRTRRLKNDGMPKYAMVSGSDSSPLWIGDSPEKPVTVFESELDGLLFEQEVGQISSAMALGSVSVRPSKKQTQELEKRPSVMVALDTDDAGAEQSWQWWRQNFSNFSRALLPSRYGKDPCEAVLAGLDLARWIKSCINLSGGLETDDVLKRYDIECHFVDSDQEAEVAVRRLMRQKSLFGFDLKVLKHPEYESHEMAGIDPNLSEKRAMAIFDGHKAVYVIDMHLCRMETFVPLFQAKEFVAHDSVSNMKHLMTSDLVVKNFECTMLAANALRGGKHSFEYLVQSCLKIRLPEKRQEADWDQTDLTDEHILSIACNAVLGFYLYDFLEPLMYECCVKKIYDLMHDAQEAIAQLELNGIGFDIESHDNLIGQWEEELQDAEEAVREIVGDEINLNSGQQLSDWLKDNLDEGMLVLLPRTKTDQIQTNAEALAKISSHDLVDHLLKYRHYKKLLSTYGESYSKYVIPVTGRIHTKLEMVIASTGRLSSHSPNIQNPPRDSSFRVLFIAKEGYVLLVADFSQIQLHIIAILSEDRKMLKGYEQGEDLHSITAAAITGIPVDELDKDARQLAKAANFGELFGQGVKNFKAKAEADYGITLTDAEAKTIKTKFARNYPGLKRWQKETAKNAAISRSIVSPSGRVLDFTRESGGYSYTGSLCFPVQGGEAEVMLAVLGLEPEYMEGIDARLVNVVHDELVFEVAEKDIEKAMEAVEELMVAGFLKIFPGASTVDLVDANVGRSWADAK